MFDHNEYIRYHKSLAESHIDLKHIDKKHLAFFGTEAQEFNEAQTNNFKVHSNIIQMLSIRGRIKGDPDAHQDEIFGGFLVLVRYENKTPQAISNAYSCAKQIGGEIIAKIDWDAENDPECEKTFSSFDLDRVSYHMTGDYNGYRGYAFEYPLTKDEIIEYNPDKWQ